MASVALVAAFVVADVCTDVPGNYRRKNQTCVMRSDCLNSNLTGRIFQPWWLDEFTNVADGLTCYNGWCEAKRKSGERCNTHDNCRSSICAPRAGTTYSVCYGINTIELGDRCPITFSDMAAHDERHHICKGNSYCAPADLNRPASTSPTVCREWASEGENCYVIWSEGANSVPLRHTCNPELSELYCQPINATWAPTGSPTLLKDRINLGRCVKVPEHESPGTCAVIRGTAQRPHCKYNEFCSRNTTDHICKDIAEDGEPCVSDTDCEASHACNSLNANGPRCREMYKHTAGHSGQFDRTLFCEIGWVLDTNSKVCVRDTYDRDCQTDADCNPANHAPDALIQHFLPVNWTRGHMFCNKKAGSPANNKCRDLFAPRSGCKDEVDELLRFTSQTLRDGRIIQTTSCFGKGCIPVRSVYKKYRFFGERLMCCTFREESNDVCLKFGGAVWSVPRNAWLAMDFDGQDGNVCPPTGISAATIAVLCVIFGVLFLVILFVLVKEYTYVPSLDEPSEEAEKSAATAPDGEESNAIPNEPKP